MPCCCRIHSSQFLSGWIIMLSPLRIKYQILKKNIIFTFKVNLISYHLESEHSLGSVACKTTMKNQQMNQAFQNN